jgi:hypothetical protein
MGSYTKFYKYFASNPVLAPGLNTLGESIYKYSGKESCNLTYSNFRNQYTIINLPNLTTKSDIIKMQAYLDFNKEKINFVNVENLNPKLGKIYSRLFANPSNKLNSAQSKNKFDTHFNV